MTRPAVRDITHSLAFDANLAGWGKATAVPFNNATQVTILGWMKCGLTATARMLLESSTNAGLANAFYFCQNAANTAAQAHTLNFFVDDVTHGVQSSIIASLPSLTSRRWVRFCLVIDQTKVSRQTEMYFDGAENSSVNVDQQCTSGIATNDLYFGDRAGASLPMIGNLIVNRIYIGKSFTAAEALAEYLTGNYPAGGTILASYDWTPNNALGIITDSGTGAKNIVLTSPVWSLDTPMQARPVTQDIPYSVVANGTSGISVPNNASLNVSNITLRAWAKLDAVPGTYAQLVGKVSGNGWADGYLLGYRGNGTLSFFVNNYSSGGIASLSLTNQNFPLKKWFMLTGTYDGATVKLYVNGRLVDRQPYATPINNSAGALVIGATPLPTYSWPGEIADVLIANVAWTDAQIRQDYLQNVQPVAGRVSRWPLDDPYTSGGVARDVWGSNNGTYPAGMVLLNDSPSHARMSDIDLGIAGQELLVRADDPGIVMIGGAVASWPDYRRYQNRALTQATSTKRPVMTRGANGRPGVLFDGVDDQLALALTTANQPYVVMLVWKQLTLGAAGVHDIVFDVASGANTIALITNSSPAASMYASSSQSLSAVPANNTYAYGVFTFNGASSSSRVNGVTQALAGSIGVNLPSGFSLGAVASGSRSTNILVMEARVLSTVPTAAEIARWESYCQKVYGL